MRPTLVSYALLITLLAACGQKKVGYQQPNAVRDLLLDRIVWRPRAVAGQPGAPVDEHQFTLTNTSDAHRYRRIQLRFDYYDQHYQRVATKRYWLEPPIAAGTAMAIAPIRLGKTHPAAKSAEVRIEDAQAE